jgi:hypothetical protein
MTAYHILLDKTQLQFNEAILAIAVKHIETQGPDSAIGGSESLDGNERLVKAVIDPTWLQMQPWFADCVSWIYEATKPLDAVVQAWLETEAINLQPTT